QPDGEPALRAASGVYRNAEQAHTLLAEAADWHLAVNLKTIAGVWLPLDGHARPSGLLHLGAKRTGVLLSDGDLTLAQTLASQVGLAISRALLVERLQARTNELELLYDRVLHAQERERKRVAVDLHDGVLQPVLGLLRHTEVTALVAEREPRELQR